MSGHATISVESLAYLNLVKKIHNPCQLICSICIFKPWQKSLQHFMEGQLWNSAMEFKKPPHSYLSLAGPDRLVFAPMEHEMEKMNSKIEELNVENRYLISQVQHKSCTGVFAMASEPKVFIVLNILLCMLPAADFLSSGRTHKLIKLQNFLPQFLRGLFVVMGFKFSPSRHNGKLFIAGSSLIRNSRVSYIHLWSLGSKWYCRPL